MKGFGVGTHSYIKCIVCLENIIHKIIWRSGRVPSRCMRRRDHIHFNAYAELAGVGSSLWDVFSFFKLRVFMRRNSLKLVLSLLLELDKFMSSFISGPLLVFELGILS